MDIYQKTWEREGVSSFDYAIEEMAELIKAMTKMREGRGSLEAVAEEVGDVLATVRVVRNIAPHLVEGKIKICERRMEKKIK